MLSQTLYTENNLAEDRQCIGKWGELAEAIPACVRQIATFERLRLASLRQLGKLVAAAGMAESSETNPLTKATGTQSCQKTTIWNLQQYCRKLAQ